MMENSKCPNYPHTLKFADIHSQLPQEAIDFLVASHIKYSPDGRDALTFIGENYEFYHDDDGVLWLQDGYVCYDPVTWVNGAWCWASTETGELTPID